MALTDEEIARRINCNCHFCQTGRIHRHAIPTELHPTTHLLLKAESLDPADSIPLMACNLCGHTTATNVANDERNR